MGRLMEIRKSGSTEQEINLAPLIDMMFILLIFFVVSTTFVRDLEIDIERPGAASGRAADLRSIRVALDRRGHVLVDGQQVQPWMVQSRVRTLLTQTTNRPVLIVADRRLPSGRLVDVVDQCRLAGAKDVGVDVERDE